MGLDSQQYKQYKQIEQLYEETYMPLCAYAMSALNDRRLAEEAVQDAFRIACAKADDLLSSSNQKGWLTNTLKNVIRNIRRSRSRLNKMMVTALSVDEMAIVSPNVDMEFEIIYSDLLGEEEFALLKMIVLNRSTLLETSQKLGISVEACKKRVQRAKKKLKKLLEKED